jgi:hypothetical protein
MNKCLKKKNVFHKRCLSLGKWMIFNIPLLIVCLLFFDEPTFCTAIGNRRFATLARLFALESRNRVSV